VIARARTAAALAIAALALALGAVGCGGDDGPDPACSLPGGQRCDGNTIVTCIDDAVTTRDCGAEQLECSYVDSASGYSCVADACALVGPLGRCVDDRLARCSGGEVTETACEDGQVCGWVDAASGYGCRAAAEPAMVAGEIHYEDRPQTGRGPVGDIQPLPVRGATVTVVDEATQAVLATVTTADNGSYVARYTAAAGTMVHVTVVARSTLAGRPITVTARSGIVHGFGSPSFPSAAETRMDVLVTSATVAEAFNVLDVAIISMDTLTADLGVAAPVPLTLIWYKGSGDGTYYSGSIHLLGATSDDDGYDDTVIAHEIGHYVEHTVGRSDSPGGGHNGSPTDPRLAWSEGYSTYWAQSSLGQPVYSDSNSGGGFFDNIDTEVTRATGTGLTQPVSESMVSEILWDLGDSTAATGIAGSDDDLLTPSTHLAVNGIQKAYLKIAILRAIGTTGVDLVDFLDGWFMIGGLSSCAPVRDIVVAKHNFPYDFNGPGGACP
jgi:hypothetical protein